MSDSVMQRLSAGVARVDATLANVLVIDDDESMRRLLAGMLSERYNVLDASSVAEGLALLRRLPVDLVLMDVVMPGMDGFEGCAAIKAEAQGFLPVLLLTGLREQEDVLKGLQAGADDFLIKPVNRSELQLRVATFVRLRRQEHLIERQLGEMREMVALKDDLVNVLVHDLRSPLAAVLSILRLLAGSVTDPESKADVLVGLSAAKQLAELTDDLLTVRLLEEGKLTAVRELQPAAGAVREAVSTLSPMAAERKVQLILNEHEAASACFDRKLVRRAVENLVSNAIKYTRGSVDIDVVTQEECVVITVADRGPGIPDAFKPTLFEKYGSVEARTGNLRRGVGLGLYMVRLVAAAHQGEVQVEDRVGGGTVFRMRLAASVVRGIDPRLGSGPPLNPLEVVP